MGVHLFFIHSLWRSITWKYKKKTAPWITSLRGKGCWSSVHKLDVARAGKWNRTAVIYGCRNKLGKQIPKNVFQRNGSKYLVRHAISLVTRVMFGKICLLYPAWLESHALIWERFFRSIEAYSNCDDGLETMNVTIFRRGWSLCVRTIVVRRLVATPFWQEQQSRLVKIRSKSKGEPIRRVELGNVWAVIGGICDI